jgi:hypothetical protein
MKDATRLYDATKKQSIQLKEDYRNKQRKVFFSWKKDNAVKVKFIWLTENTQGTGVENKTFENM